MTLRRLPRILVTGFGPFPGAPVNPTAALVERLLAEPPELAGAAAFHAEVLDVDYAEIGPRLSQLGRDFSPDIAIHFGLANECRGFRLERTARNRHAGIHFDNRGVHPEAGAICSGPAELPSRLPLEAIAAALQEADLPVEWSEDAGSYLCNTVMTLSLAHACDGFTPDMSGFIHVPLVGDTAPLDGDELVSGAELIVGACVSEWQHRSA